MAEMEGTVTPGAAAEVTREETPQLIAAGKVAGTPVYNRTGERLGTIEDLMIDKRSGRVAYAIMSFGGFLGIGEHQHPLPWSILRYDVAQGGYVVDIDRDRLDGAPAYAAGDVPDWAGGGWTKRVDDFWGSGTALS